MIIFSDPGDVAVQGIEAENVYPNTIFLPGRVYLSFLKTEFQNIIRLTCFTMGTTILQN